jgi:alcohol dehydrogenase YqhD (iron-dependent ADH family)
MMKDFQYVNPCKVIFGKDRVDEAANAVSCYGKKVLFVYGKSSIKASGLYDRISRLLRRSGIDVIDYGGVRSNPVLSHVVAGIKLAKAHQVDCVLAVGGGSVIDEAKVIAVGAVSDRDVWTFFSDGTKPNRALPIVTVLTLAASGSEMNGGAVLTNDVTGEKLGIGAWCIIPRASILDPSMTFTVPREFTVYGFVDAFSHVMEGYFNGECISLTLQNEMAEGVFRSIIKASLDVLSDPDNYQYRADAMWSACMAHNGILNAGRGKVVYEIHCIAHVLGALFDMPHGAAISVAMPAWMQFRMSSLCSRIGQFGRNVFHLGNSDESSLAAQTLQQMKDWLVQMGSHISLYDMGIDRSHIPVINEKLKCACLGGGVRNIQEEQVDQLVKSLFLMRTEDRTRELNES